MQAIYDSIAIRDMIRNRESDPSDQACCRFQYTVVRIVSRHDQCIKSLYVGFDPFQVFGQGSVSVKHNGLRFIFVHANITMSRNQVEPCGCHCHIHSAYFTFRGTRINIVKFSYLWELHNWTSIITTPDIHRHHAVCFIHSSFLFILRAG